MLADGDLVNVRGFAQRTEDVRMRLGSLVRDLNTLHVEAKSMELVLSGPARDAHAKVSDAQLQLAECEGSLRQLEVSVAALLQGQNLHQQVSALGWTFDGWHDEEGWTAYRGTLDRETVEVQSDRRADGLLYKLKRRNAEESAHV